MSNAVMNLKADITGTRAFIIGELNEILNVLTGHQEDFIDNKATWEGDGYKEELTLISPESDD